MGCSLLLDQRLEVVAAEFARFVGRAVDESALGQKHRHLVALVVWLGPSEVRGHRAVASQDAVGIRTLLAGDHMSTKGLSGGPDCVGQAAVGRPVPDRERFEDRVERGPLEARRRLRGILPGIDRADVEEPAAVG